MPGDAGLIIPCVGAILYNRQGQVMLQKRDEKPGLAFPGQWTVWGGQVEPGETPLEAERRELEEELELTGLPLRWWKMVEWPWRDGITIQQHLYLAPFDGDPEALTQHEGQDRRFFSRAELDGIPVAFNFRGELEAFFAEYFPGEPKG